MFGVGIIGIILVYHFNLEWYWYIVVALGIALDFSDNYVSNINSKRTVDRLLDIETILKKKK